MYNWLSIMETLIICGLLRHLAAQRLFLGLPLWLSIQRRVMWLAAIGAHKDGRNHGSCEARTLLLKTCTIFIACGSVAPKVGPAAHLEYALSSTQSCSAATLCALFGGFKVQFCGAAAAP